MSHTTGLKRPQQADYHHGRSPAAWTGSIMALIGFVLITLGLIAFDSWPVIWFGSALVVIAGLATLVLQAMGYGQPKRDYLV